MVLKIISLGRCEAMTETSRNLENSGLPMHGHTLTVLKIANQKEVLKCISFHTYLKEKVGTSLLSKMLAYLEQKIK